MEQYISQEEVRRIIISDMVKKRNSIVPVIGEDTYPFSVPVVLLWLSDGTLRSAFKEGSMNMRRYTVLTNIGALAYETGLVAPRTYVHEAMNICGTMKSNKFSLYKSRNQGTSCFIR